MDSKCTFLKTAKVYGIQTETGIEAFNSPKEFLLELKRFGIKIIVAFVPQSQAVDLLCTTYINGQIMLGFLLTLANLKRSIVIVKLMPSTMLYIYFFN